MFNGEQELFFKTKFLSLPAKDTKLCIAQRESRIWCCQDNDDSSVAVVTSEYKARAAVIVAAAHFTGVTHSKSSVNKKQKIPAVWSWERHFHCWDNGTFKEVPEKKKGEE